MKLLNNLMSSKSDEIISMNYSITSLENTKKGEENKEKKIIKDKNNLDKKKSSFKNQNLSATKNKKYKNIISLPELDNNNKNQEQNKSKQKLHLTSSSFNKDKINLSLYKNANRTFNFSSSLVNDNISLNNYFNNKKIKNNKQNEETPIKTIEYLKTEIKNKNKIIESLISSNNNIPYTPDNKNSLVNILSTKKKNQKNGNFPQGEEGNGPNESKLLEKKYNDIKEEFEKQKNHIGTLRKQEKITKNKEDEMKNRILLEQCNKLNFLYFDALRKLIEYEDSIKNIHNLKETLIKKEYILIELQDKYSKAILDLNKCNQEIENLKSILSKKNIQLKQNKKNLDYYFQLNQKLLIEADNIDMNPKILALKNDYENKITEIKKSLMFYKEENYRKDRIILDLNSGNNNLDDIYNNKKGNGNNENNNNNSLDKNNKRFLFKNAQKINKEYFLNKENIDLKNKINTLQEKISKLNKKLKDYELKEKYQLRNKTNTNHINHINSNINNLNKINNNNYLIKNNNINLNNANNNQEIIGNSFSQIDYLTKSKENIEDEDCDFMPNYNMNEFLYILKKCFEAQKINKGDIESKILNGETFNLLIKKENYNIFVLTVSANFCNLLKIVKTRDQLDTLSFVKTFLYNNFIANENKIDEFQNIFLNCFPDIIIYDKELDEIYMKKISGYFKDKVDILKNEFESFDMNKKGTITFIALKKIVEKMKINLKKEILEYMIFYMKKSCINNSNYINKEKIYSLRDLNYKSLIEEINIHINNNNIDINDNSTNNEITENNNNEGFLNSNNNEENSYIEITNEEYNEKISLIMSSISSEIMKKSNNNTNEYINILFNKYIITDDDGHQIIELSKLIDEIRNSLYIELNQIEIFCLYSKFKINEDKLSNSTELIDYESFKNEILFYENQQIKENTPIEFINSNNKNNEELYNEENIIEKKEINKNEDKFNENKNENENENYENHENNENNEGDENNDEIKKGESQIEEYNDFENNDFDNEDESINKLEKIITGNDKE